ncbi:MAG: Smr/MutS family protein [Gemmatimonadaceae bacterium]
MSRRSRAPGRDNTPGVLRALDEASFGPGRTLNLRAALPTAAEATSRAEAWLRERQMAQAGDVLVITGRGKSSDGGVAVLKPAVERLLFSLRRRGVVAEWREHNEGSFAVSLAPVSALFDAPKRKRDAPRVRPVPGSLAGLSSSTLELLRAVALRSLDGLGVPAPGEAFIDDEMLATFSKISSGLPAAGLEDALRAALGHALMEMEE